MSKQITIQKAREYYDLGVIAAFHLVRDPMGSGWIVCIEGTSGASWTLHTVPVPHEGLGVRDERCFRLSGRQFPFPMRG